MNKSSNIIALAMRHKQIVFILTVLFCVFGIYSLQVMPRNEFPDFTIRQGLVVGVYPGASSEQVEAQLATKVEGFLFGFKEVNRAKTYSISKEGMLIVFVEVHDEVADPDAFWDKVKFGLQDLKTQLPPQVLALIANNDFGDTAALLLTVESKEKSKKQLQQQLKIIEAELRKVPTVAKVKHFGLQNEEIVIHFDKDKLAFYGINYSTVLAAIQLESSVFYTGEIDNKAMITPIRVSTAYTSENSISNQIVYVGPQGRVIRLKDVAVIKRTYETPAAYILNNGFPCLLISLEMQTGNNIVNFGMEVDAALASVQKKLPADVQINKIANMPEAVNTSIQHFLTEFSSAIVALVLIIMLFLPFRLAAVAGITIPISIFITIGILNLLQMELNTVSLAGLIVVLGMVVDNAIVVIDGYVEKLDKGIDHWTAAVDSTTELFIPIFCATFCIIATYLPVPFFLTGQVGDFAGPLPITIGIALIVSLLLSCFLIPYMCYTFIKKGLKQPAGTTKKFSLLDNLQKGYDVTLDWAFKLPFLTIMFGVGSVVVGIYILTFVPRQLFPKVERNQFAIEIYLPIGSTLDQTNFVMDSLQNILLRDERVKNVAAFVGESSPRFHTTYAPNFPAKNYGQMIVNTQTTNDAIAILEEYEDQYRDIFPNAYVRMKQLDMLPTKAPIEVRIAGDDLVALKIAANKVKHVMQTHKAVIWARTNYNNPLQSIQVQVDDERANRLGISRGMIAASVSSSFSGLPIGTIWEGDYAVPVKIVNRASDRNSFDDLNNQLVSAPLSSKPVRLRQVATLSMDWSEGTIIRRNGIRTITIRADVARTALPYKVLADLKPAIAEISTATEGELQFTYGGEEEYEYENYIPIGQATVVGIVLIFFVLLFEFKRLKHILLIMTTMPLSVLGTALGILITGYPFGMTGSLGIMSLMGIVVRNGIILVDYADELRRKEGFKVLEAAIAAGKRRMRPIFLTSFASAIGVVPMIYSGSTLWGPLGVVVCFGLLVSMILTLYLLPILYHQFFKNETVA